MAPRIRKVQTLSRDIGLGSVNVKSHFLRNTKDSTTPVQRRKKATEQSTMVKPTEEYMENKLKASRNPSQQRKDMIQELDTQDATRTVRATPH